MTGCAPDSLFSKYVQRAIITKRKTTNPQMLNIALYKTALGQRIFYNGTVELNWNLLDSTFKLRPTPTDFKCSLKRSFISKLLET